MKLEVTPEIRARLAKEGFEVLETSYEVPDQEYQFAFESWAHIDNPHMEAAMWCLTHPNHGPLFLPEKIEENAGQAPSADTAAFLKANRAIVSTHESLREMAGKHYPALRADFADVKASASIQANCAKMLNAQFGKFIDQHHLENLRLRGDFRALHNEIVSGQVEAIATAQGETDRVCKVIRGFGKMVFWGLLAICSLLALLTILSIRAHAQKGTSRIDVITFQDSGGSNVKTFAAPFKIKCSTNMTCTASGSTLTMVSAAGSGGTPGGSDTQVQFNDATAFGGIAGMTYIKASTLVKMQAGTKFSLTDTSDLTKAAQFDLSGISTATTRTFILPNANGTFCLLSTCINTVSVTAPITSTGGQTPSIGMVNQGTTTTVLHGNAAGNPAFAAVTSADTTGTFPSTPHALLDASVDSDTTNTAPTTGLVAYANATPKWTGLAAATQSAGGGWLNETQATLAAPSAPVLTVSNTGGTLSNAAVLAAPTVAPVLTAANTGGSLAFASALTVFVKYTINTTASGETTPSPETSIVLNSNGCTSGTACSVTVAVPPLPANASGYTVYSSITTNTEKQQTTAAACINILTSCVIGTIGAGAVVPVTNTGAVTTVYVVTTQVNAFGETISSAESAIAINATNGCVLTSTACVVNVPAVTLTGNATGYTVYSSSARGAEQQQTALAACVNKASGVCVIGTLGTGTNPPIYNTASDGTAVVPSWKSATGTGNNVLGTGATFNPAIASATNYYADQYCHGSLDVGLCINNTLAAMTTVGSYKYGTIRLDGFTPGTVWVWNTLVTISSPGVSIVGPGSGVLEINASVLTGDHLRIQTSPFDVRQAGKFGGFALIGGSQASAVCVHYGDITAGWLDDLRCTGFTGTNAVGLWMDNVTTFTERTLMTRVHMDGNTKGFKFTNTNGATSSQSFGYTRILDAKCNANANQTCLSFEGGILQNSFVTLNVNMGANTATSVSLTGLEYSGGPGSLWIDNFYDIVAECTGCTTGVLLSTASGTTLTGTGIIHSLNSGTTSSISGTAQMYLPYGDPLQTYSNGKQLNVNTSSSATSGANFNSPAFASLGSYWTGAAAATDSWTLTDTLGAGANPTTTLKLGHAGSSGASNVDFTGPNMSISSFELGGVYGTTGQFEFNSNNGGVSVGGVSATAFSLTNPATLNAVAFDLLGDIGAAGFVGAVGGFRASAATAANGNGQLLLTPGGTVPTTPVAGAIWIDTNEEKHLVQTSTSGAFKFYDSGGTNAITDTSSGTITSYTVNRPLVAKSGVQFGVNASNVITQNFSGDTAHALSQTAKTAAVTTFTLCAATAGTACGQVGQYRISYNFWGSGTACSAVTAGSVGLNLTWTDENAVAHTTISVPMWDQKSAANGILFNFNTALGTEGASGSYIISTNGTIIQAATTYTSCTTGTGQYNLRMTVEQLQ